MEDPYGDRSPPDDTWAAGEFWVWRSAGVGDGGAWGGFEGGGGEYSADICAAVDSGDDADEANAGAGDGGCDGGAGGGWVYGAAWGGCGSFEGAGGCGPDGGGGVYVFYD